METKITNGKIKILSIMSILSKVEKDTDFFLTYNTIQIIIISFYFTNIQNLFRQTIEVENYIIEQCQFLSRFIYNKSIYSSMEPKKE